MPTVLEINGYKFKFFSNENDEPPHIHITKGNGNAKYWLVPTCEEEFSYGFKLKERRDIKKIVLEQSEFLVNKWYEYFNR
jgi:hypothetical protein